jgi:hypothetical protein
MFKNLIISILLACVQLYGMDEANALQKLPIDLQAQENYRAQNFLPPLPIELGYLVLSKLSTSAVTAPQSEDRVAHELLTKRRLLTLSLLRAINKSWYQILDVPTMCQIAGGVDARAIVTYECKRAGDFALTLKNLKYLDEQTTIKTQEKLLLMKNVYQSAITFFLRNKMIDPNIIVNVSRRTSLVFPTTDFCTQNTPSLLHFAVRFDADIEFIRMLITQGADILLTCNSCQTKLDQLPLII